MKTKKKKKKKTKFKNDDEKIQRVKIYFNNKKK